MRRGPLIPTRLRHTALIPAGLIHIRRRGVPLTAGVRPAATVGGRITATEVVPAASEAGASTEAGAVGSTEAVGTANPNYSAPRHKERLKYCLLCAFVFLR